MHRSDQDLQATVSDELLFTPSVDSHLTVSVEDGIVTLVGDVASLPQRRAAVRAAERVWGVKNVTDRITVRSEGADDADLARSATSMLEWSIDVPIDAITVEVNDGQVTLTGEVTWDFQRAAAARAVGQLRGINGLTNKVFIREHTNVSIVKDAVQKAIRRNTPLDADEISVEAHGHTLTLSGRVRSAAERRQTEHLAWSAAGVATVENNLTITY